MTCRWDRETETYRTNDGESCRVDEYGDPTHHCTARRTCSWHVAAHELTCARCIAGARRDLRWIGDLSALMLLAAINDGIESEAANLAGPSVDPHGWSERRRAQRQHLDTWATLGRITEAQALHARVALEEDDERHPGRVLGTWAMMLTEDYGHDMPCRAAIGWCVDYLDRQLHRVAHDPEQDFGLLARDLRKCRQHLEVVLDNDTRPDKGAPCPACVEERGTGPRLHRVYAERWQASDDSRDAWTCPANRSHTWSEYDYRLRVADVYATATRDDDEEATA